MVECSAEGTCDRSSGECSCSGLFEGAACERLRCPADPSGLTPSCSGHGQCLTMAKLADSQMERSAQKKYDLQRSLKTHLGT